MEEYKSKLFGIYWMRWMASAVIMLPFMLMFEALGVGLIVNLILGQSVGAVIFFKIDKWIFKDKEKKCFEKELNDVKEAMNVIKEEHPPYEEEDYSHRTG